MKIQGKLRKSTAELGAFFEGQIHFCMRQTLS